VGEFADCGAVCADDELAAAEPADEQGKENVQRGRHAAAEVHAAGKREAPREQNLAVGSAHVSRRHPR